LAETGGVNHRVIPVPAAVAVLLCAVAVRGGILWLHADSLRGDPDGYRRLAENIVANGVLGERDIPTAYRPPLYPLLLAALARTAGLTPVSIGGLHLMLGVATVWLVLRLGIDWGLDRYALLGAALVACDPILLNQSTQVMTETLAAFLAALVLVLLTVTVDRSSMPAAICAGLAIALAVLCRPTFLVMLVLAPPTVLWLLRKYMPDAPARDGGDIERTPSPARRASEEAPSLARRVGMATIVLTFALGGLAPWAIRNQLVFGRPILTTTHGGYTLLLGNNPSFYEHLHTAPLGSVWSAEELQRGLSTQGETKGAPAKDHARSELETERRNYELAWQNIRAQPALFLRACLHRITRMWGVLPYQIDADEGAAGRWLRYATALWYTLELALAVVGVWSLRSRLTRTPWLFGVVLAVGFTAVHTVYWTDLRMRAPLTPVVALATAAGGSWIASKRRIVND
jgi:hypothetical protein